MTPDQILAFANLFISLGSTGLVTFLKIKNLLNLTDDEKANVQQRIADSDAIDDDTIQKAEAWKAANGFVN